MRRKALVCVTVLLGWMAGSGARADWTFLGSARQIAMGGAGIAVVDRSNRTTPDNPASLAFNSRRVVVDFPSFGFSMSGVSLFDTLDFLFGNPDPGDSLELAKEFGSKDIDFGIHLDWGVRFGHISARANGIAKVMLRPDAAFKNWSKTGNGDLSLLPSTSKADALGAAIYSLPSVAIAERISPEGSPTRVEAGVRINLMRAFYSHYLVRKNSAGTELEAVPASEIGPGRTVLSKDGIGVDLGFLVHPRDHDGLSGAIIVTNLLGTTFRFDGTDVNGAPARYDLHPRSVSLGSAWRNKNTLFALDFIDVTNSYGPAQVRFGGEYTTAGLAFRAGYASARGFTVGFGWGFLQVAYGARAPLQVVQTLRF